MLEKSNLVYRNSKTLKLQKLIEELGFTIEYRDLAEAIVDFRKNEEKSMAYRSYNENCRHWEAKLIVKFVCDQLVVADPSLRYSVSCSCTKQECEEYQRQQQQEQKKRGLCNSF